MRRASTIIALTLCTFLCVSISSAQQTLTVATAASTSVPNLIRYSGTLKDAQGAPVSPGTAVGVTFAVYNQQEGGAAVWQETQNVTPDANGQYNVILGSATATGLPDDLFMQQEQRWLGVQVQGQEEQARVLLVSVPYALKAHEADTLGGLPASAFVQAAPSNASGSGSTDLATAVNALSTAGNAGSTVHGKGAGASRRSTNCASLTANAFLANYIPLFDPTTLCNLATSAMYQSGNNIGIGTMLPSAALDVNGAIDASPIPKAVPTNTGNYQILENPVLSIGWPSNQAVVANQNTLVGVLAGAQGFVQSPGTGNTGTSETFVGYNAGFHNQAGSNNTAVGEFAGYRNVNGNGNTSVGAAAGFGVFGETVSNNTIMGFDAGYSNSASNVSFYGYQSGYNNAANGNSFYGNQAGFSNTTATGSTFFGYQAGYKTMTDDQTIGSPSGNAFFGYQAGFNNTSSSFPPQAGSGNTFTGYQAGYSNTIDAGNTFLGYQAGYMSNPGQPPGHFSANTFAGYQAGYSNTTGTGNAYFGWAAGTNSNGTSNAFFGSDAGSFGPNGNGDTFVGAAAGQNAAGNYNTSVGFEAGVNNTGNNDVYIANLGPSSGSESNTIRIGGDIGVGYGSQTATYIAGIYNSTPGGTNQEVCVDATGKLWGTTGTCNTSSRRFKDQIADMGDSSNKLFQLRPVSFFYKPQYDDGTHSQQYGLIAEEVAKVYPEMAVYDKDGRPYSVKYRLLAPMLLNELQKEHKVVMAQQDELQTQLQQIKAQRQEIDSLKRELQLQNASLQVRLQKLESYVATQMKTASEVQTAATTVTAGGLR